MAQLAFMKDANFPNSMQVMTDERVRVRFKTLVTSFEGCGLLYDEADNKLTMAATNSALMLWFTSLSREKAVLFLETELPKLKAFLRDGVEPAEGHYVPAPAPAPAVDTTAPARRVPGSTGKAVRGKQNSG